MYTLFFICVLGAIIAVPIHFLSVEHLKFRRKYGEEKGAKISEVYGRLSAYLLFTPFLIGLLYLISRKEEEELTREFGENYREYKSKVPMLIPRFRM